MTTDPWDSYVPPAPRPAVKATHRRVHARDAEALDRAVSELGHDLATLDTGYDEGTCDVYALIPIGDDHE